MRRKTQNSFTGAIKISTFKKFEPETSRTQSGSNLYITESTERNDYSQSI